MSRSDSEKLPLRCGACPTRPSIPAIVTRTSDDTTSDSRTPTSSPRSFRAPPSRWRSTIPTCGAPSTPPSPTPRQLVLTGAGEHVLGVLARVPDVGSLPTGQPVAIIQAERRARVVASHATPGEATFADVEPIADQPTNARIDAATRELRADARRDRRAAPLAAAAGDPAHDQRSWRARRCRSRCGPSSPTPIGSASCRRSTWASVSTRSTPGRAATSTSCRSPRRSATTSARGWTSSNASTCCASSSTRSARNWVKATTTSPRSSANNSTGSTRPTASSRSSPRRSTGSNG